MLFIYLVLLLGLVSSKRKIPQITERSKKEIARLVGNSEKKRKMLVLSCQGFPNEWEKLLVR